MAAAFEPIAARPAPVRTEGVVPWIRANLFANAMSTVTTLALIAVAVYVMPGFLQWAYVDAVFRSDADACQAARGVGEQTVGEEDGQVGDGETNQQPRQGGRLHAAGEDQD